MALFWILGLEMVEACHILGGELDARAVAGMTPIPGMAAAGAAPKPDCAERPGSDGASAAAATSIETPAAAAASVNPAGRISNPVFRRSRRRGGERERRDLLLFDFLGSHGRITVLQRQTSRHHQGRRRDHNQ